LTALAAVIANILAFHITMMPSGLPVAVVVAILWTIVALPFRAIFAPLFSQRPVAQDIDPVHVHVVQAQHSGASA
jgi:hypothetical protein